MTGTSTAVLKVSSQVVVDQSTAARVPEFLPTGAIGQTAPRGSARVEGIILASGTGKEYMVRIRLLAGQVVSRVGFVVTTGPTTPTHQWFTLRDSSRVLLGVTSDDTTTAWSTNAAKDLPLATPYTVPADGDYYVGIMVTAATMPTMAVISSAFAVTGIAPIVSGYDNTNTGLTTPATAPATSAALTASGNMPYAYVK